MLFSIIIPTCHRNDLLAVCLERVAASVQRIGTDRCEIIVTDDGSASTAEAMLRQRFPAVRWVAGPRRGPAANRNHGARAAVGEWLVFTDDDCLPDPGWLPAYLTVAGAAPALQVMEGRTWADRPQTHPLEISPVNHAGGNLWSCNFAIRRECFLALGGFDERFPYAAMEDMELNARLQKRGINPRFVADASVLHPWRRSANWRRQQRQYLKSRLILEELHPGKAFPWSCSQLLLRWAKLTLTEHVPFILRQPLEACRIMPALWQSYLVELSVTRHRPPADHFKV
jgi:GT2 family glycosyltransferase